MDTQQRDTLISAGMLLIRVFLGIGLAAHGYGKFFGEHGIAGFAGFLKTIHVPSPQVAAYVSATTELVGGILVALVAYANCSGPFGLQHVRRGPYRSPRVVFHHQ